MEEVTTWKSHSFTLLVFTGIVVLCSIFFILGMLVARAQAQKFAVPEGILKAEAKAPPAEDRLEIPDQAKNEAPVVFDRTPKLEPPVVESSRAEPPVAKADPTTQSPVAEKPSANIVHYQIAAVKRRSDAEKLLSGLKKKGFRALILPPAPNDPKPFFRVQVGPFSDPVEAGEVKRKLEKDGYQAILKK